MSPRPWDDSLCYAQKSVPTSKSTAEVSAPVRLLVAMEKKLAALAAGQHGLITRRQALPAGLGPAAVQWRLRRGDLERVHQGVYRVAGSRRTVEQAILAACLAAGPDALASHATAAELHGLPAGGSGTHVTVPWERRTRVQGLMLHRVARLDRVDIVMKRGVPVTSVARTIIDLAAELSPGRLEEVLDHALAARMVSLEQLRYRLSSGHPRSVGRRLAGGTRFHPLERLTAPP